MKKTRTSSTLPILLLCALVLALEANGRVLFYPTALKSSTNLLAQAKWRPPKKETCRAVPTKGGPFSADEPAWEIESLAPESAYWRTYAHVKPGHSYLVGTWVKYANAKILLWNYGTQVDGKPSNQRLYCFGGFQYYLTPYMSDELQRKLGGNPDEWRLLFRRLDYPVALKSDTLCLAMGIYMATGKMTMSAPFLVDVTDAPDRSLTIDIVGEKPIRRLTVEHVGERDTIWQRDFPEPVADFHAALSGVTDFGRGLDSANRIAGHALNVFYADGTATKVFAPQENVFTQR